MNIEETASNNFRMLYTKAMDLYAINVWKKIFICMTLCSVAIPLTANQKSEISETAEIAVNNAVQQIRQWKAEGNNSGMRATLLSHKASELEGDLKNADPNIRHHAARYLGILASSNSISELGSTATRDSDYRVRQSAILSLARIKGNAVVGWLSTCLNDDPNQANKQAAAIALGLVGGEDAKAFLRTKVSVVDRAFLLSVYQGLALLGDNTGYVAALNLLNNEDADIRAQAAQVVGLIGKPDDISILERHLRDADRNVQFKCIEAIYKIKFRSKSYPDKLEFLKTSLDDASGTIRLWAARQLLDMNEDQGLEILRVKTLAGSEEARNILSWKVQEINLSSPGSPLK